MSIVNERGQITVFLSLSFLVFLGLALCVLEGVHAYMESSLAEEAITETGNEILANYDRYLFEKYHVFFLDPREKDCITEEAEDFLNGYCSSGFYGFRCLDLAVTDEKRAVDEKGLFLRYQINEYMKYRSQVDVFKALTKMISDSKGLSKDIEDEKRDFSISEGDSSSSKKDSGDKKEEEEKVSEETIKYRQSWTKMKGTLEGILHSGVLVYAADNPGSLSSLTISKGDLPSQDKAGGGKSNGIVSLPNFSFNKLAEWRSFLSSDNLASTALTEASGDIQLLEYMVDCFSFYGGEESEDETALKYELEYIAGGKSSDLANLKYVVNRILLIRFITNYAYASQDASITSQAKLMAEALTGIFGMPQAADAVKILLVAALSYSESLLELHALLKGEKLAIVKNSENWNLSFVTCPIKLATKASIKEVDFGISYRDYLLFFCMMNSETSILYRMMDIMQLNARLHEPGFLMKDCLFSFKWKVNLACSKWFVNIPKISTGGGQYYEIETDRFVSY